MKNQWVIGVLSAALMMAVGLSILGARRSKESLQSELLDAVPSRWPGWEVRDLPVADTPEMKKAVQEMLNYDKAILREFNKDGRNIVIYVAYWRPGRFHPRLITQHTPENCWVGNGMELMQSTYGAAMKFTDWATWPTQYLTFNAGGRVVNVAYWHLQDGALSGYAVGTSSESRSFVDNFIRDIRYGVGEQFFIRISGDGDLAEWEKSDLAHAILSAFRPVLEQRAAK